MIINGREIADSVCAQLRERVSSCASAPRLTIITCAPNFETKKYLELKKGRATDIGISTTIIELPSTATTDDVIAEIQKAIPHADGVVVQLPLPEHIDAGRVVRTIPPSHDVDALNPHTLGVLSPVVGSIQEILTRNNVDVTQQHVTILGSGKLVGIPAYEWFTAHDAYVSVVTKETLDIPHYTRNADIIVCGVGVPGLLTPDMIREGVIVLDAGTSEDGGELRGDALASCAEKASLFTPVPGGIGPITIAILLKNAVSLAEKRMK